MKIFDFILPGKGGAVAIATPKWHDLCNKGRGKREPGAAKGRRLRGAWAHTSAGPEKGDEGMALHVPKVRLTVENSGESTLGAVRAEAVGLGLMLMLALDVALGGDQGAGQMPGMLRYAFCGAAAAVLLAGAVTDKRFHALFRTLKPVVAAMALLVPGAVLGISNSWAPEGLETGIKFAGGACLGASMAILVFLWGISFGRLESRDITLNAPVGIFLGVSAYAVLYMVLPSQLALHLACTLPQFAHAALLRNRVTDRLPDPDMRENAYFAELSVRRASFALMIAPATFCIGLILGNIVMHAGTAMKPEGPVHAVACVVLSLLAAGLTAACCYMNARKGLAYGRAFRNMVPLMAVLMPPLAMTAFDQAPFVPNLLLLMNFTILCAMAWAYLASLAQGFRLSPVYLFGLGQGCVALGYVLAAPVNALLSSVVAEGLPSNAYALTVCLIGLCVATSLLPRREDIMSIVTSSYKPAELWDAAEDEGDALQGQAADALPRSHSGTPYEEEGEEVRKGRFVRRCEHVADTFLLSRRETDVLFLLAKGRNVNYITQQLGISEGTVKTHVNHVYKKCGVHGRQELICLIDSFGE